MDWRFDVSFKWLFGRPSVSNHLVQFLNDVEEDSQPEVLSPIWVNQLQYLNVEQLYTDDSNIKKMVYDLYCETPNGSRVIIEMQKSSHPGWDIRMFHYLTKVLRENIHVQHVLIAILDFKYHWKGTKLGNQVVKHYRIGLSGELITIELGRFHKSLEELNSSLDNWLFLFKNSSQLKEVPLVFRQTIFEKILNMSRINTLPKEQLEDWQQELMDNQYIQGAIKMAAEEAAEEAAKEAAEKAYNEGLIKGRKAEKKLMIQRLRKQGFSEDQIKKLFELD